MGGKHWKLQFGKIAAAGEEREWKHRELAILGNYICTKGFRGFGWLSTLQTYMARSHRPLPRPTSCKDLALLDFEKPVLWGIFERMPRSPFAFSHGTKTSVDPKNHWTVGYAEIQVAPTASQEVGCSMSQASRSAASGSQLTRHSGLGLGCSAQNH